jgi:hypothetical protein
MVLQMPTKPPVERMPTKPQVERMPTKPQVERMPTKPQVERMPTKPQVERMPTKPQVELDLGMLRYPPEVAPAVMEREMVHQGSEGMHPEFWEFWVCSAIPLGVHVLV